MSELAASFSASQYIPQFWTLLLHPLVPIGFFVLGQWYRIRKGATGVSSRVASTAVLACCAFTPAFAMLAFAADSNGRTEALSQIMDAVRIQRAYDTLCKFTPDQRTSANADWATNVLRDHVLWADHGAPFERQALPASAALRCDRTPFPDERASRERYAKLATLFSFLFSCFIVTAFLSVWGLWWHLLPKYERMHRTRDTTRTPQGSRGPA